MVAKNSFKSHFSPVRTIKKKLMTRDLIDGVNYSLELREVGAEDLVRLSFV